MSDAGKRPRPQPTPETRHFWEGAARGELLLQKDNDTGEVYFPPRPFTPGTGNTNVSVFKASGRGRLYSYVIHQRPAPGFTPPYSIAVVELEEGPRMMTNIIGVPQTPEALQLDMKVKAVFAKQNDAISLVHFTPEVA